MVLRECVCECWGGGGGGFGQLANGWGPMVVHARSMLTRPPHVTQLQIAHQLSHNLR